MHLINEQLSVFSLRGFGQAEVREGEAEGAFSRPVQTERSSTEGQRRDATAGVAAEAEKRTDTETETGTETEIGTGRGGIALVRAPDQSESDLFHDGRQHPSGMPVPEMIIWLPAASYLAGWKRLAMVQCVCLPCTASGGPESFQQFGVRLL
ncbi:hypothetical protein D9C73_023567 [Collichthys lucidus]|uniref:Uncharacterized protein n=1 Tax=Collichthys lucidus TaxID=240159 RepID=A0A4V6ASS0_COLLU|nr:hypothetical protein D9C73_023567 [Collichthys lucidus]